ncbi:hypothetical protein G7Y89_g4992 [Cudoniella acicularis]|uniref:Major facilitator superfamily (MFS) profile domain-containing protein n=1 Tax=Cudoniella acicularis TaxID=354080 RepID=A0A8H4RNC4_9HELO|nr:hypothetical protein G7Y89_g4992 [Cudoniella acicularis]
MAVDTSESAATSEVTPLLIPSQSDGGSYTQPENNKINHYDEDAPMPTMQIVMLCYVRMVEPIAFFSIFPFTNQMLLNTGNVSQEDVGFYSGWIESTFSLTQMLLMISWGRASDLYGRKPVLVFFLAGVTIATTLFGLPKTVWQMILFRCVAGIFAGTIATVRAMISENMTRKTQALTFSWFAFTAFTGTFLGPLVGGVLANPAEQYPSVFGGFQFFINYPYALATIGTVFSH